jgi:hypothetical protein
VVPVRDHRGPNNGFAAPVLVHRMSGWFIGVSWETGQRFFPCSQGWRYDPADKSVRITGGGEISARVISPPPLGTPPLPPGQWPSRQLLANRTGWRVSGTGSGGTSTT